MRKTLFSLALAVAVLSSCSSDDIVNNPMDKESLPTSRSLHENILSFSSEEEYNALLDSLSTLSDEELLQWESGQKGFTSMYRMHSEALGQILNATCKEEYESIKAACQTDFIFNDKDSTDLSIYMPVLNVSKAITLNPEGFVCIAGERKNMKEFENYDGYKKELSLLYPVPLGVTIENGINRVHVKTKKRKFTAQIGMRGNQQAIRVNASKKILWGWVEYTTAYYWKYTPNGPVQFGKEVKSGHDIMILGNPFPNGAKLYMWTRGTGEENCGIMTVQL
jgi:hypothetical protein